MKKKMLILIVIFIITSLFISPNIVMANNLDNNTNNLVLLSKSGSGGGSFGGRTDENSSGTNPEDNEVDTDDQVCKGLLGPLKEDLKFILNIIKIIGPILVVVFTTYELFAAVASNDDDALKKGMKTLTTRIVLVAILFFLPILLNLLLGFVDNKYSTCIG